MPVKNVTMRPILISLDRDRREYLDVAAEAARVSRAEYIRRLLDKDRTETRLYLEVKEDDSNV
jgi:hypothetical protein